MKYLVWDFDGTLGYRSGGWSKACVDVLGDATPDSGGKSKTFDDIFRRDSRGIPPINRNDWQVFDDTIPTLSRLSSAGWTHLVPPNHVPELESILQGLGLTEYIEEIHVSAETGYEKPHPEAFRMVVSTIEDDATVWMIGDSYCADVNYPIYGESC